jgi:acetyl-CoA carboxylase biotin carboxyl carrier protein
MDTKNITKLIEIFESSNLQKIVYKEKDFELHLEKPSAHVPVAPHPHVVVDAAPRPAAKSEKGIFVTSPMVGTFYSRPAPDQPAFSKAGDAIQENSVVCIIEAMKVMNEVKAQVAGKVVEVLVKDGQSVEFGTRLFRIEP